MNKNQLAADSNNYFAKSTTFGIDWKVPHSTKEAAFEKAQWFVNEWAKIGVEASARVFYRDGSPVADFKSSVLDRACTILNHIEV